MTTSAGRDRGRAGPRRRTVLTAGAVTAGAALTGCAEYGDEDGPAGSAGPAEPPPATKEQPDTATPAPDEGGQQPSGGEELADTADIPVGGGKVFKDREVVVVQPEEGTFKAFSAVCTHQGCIVAEVSDGTINCTCHGSRYRVADASVAGGPAPRPLPPRKITVTGKSIRLT
ncbi:Rieske (2Fe-2S) protein [Streptomyces monticola]|uniref:Cytochrome bc1 complex Rieske iron-sulfur subunit n=1 Tax=Streptomyces monticola TaxID=2666263 RepID=A0ABW2JNK8_9ACTN